MKCICGCEFNSKFCPNCGNKAEDVAEESINNSSNQFQNQQINYNQNQPTQNQPIGDNNMQQNATYPVGGINNLQTPNMGHQNPQYDNQQYFNYQQNNVNMQASTNPSNQATANVKEIVSGAMSDYRKGWFTRLSIGAIVTAVIMFAMGMFLAGLLLVVGGVLIFPPVLNRSKKRKLTLIIGVVLIVVGILGAVTYEDRGEQLIEYVKQYQEPGTYYSIGEFMELIEDSGYKCTWSYTESDGYEFVTVSYTDELGRNKIIFLVDDYPELYDVTLDGVSDYYLYEEFNSRLFGE